MNPRALARKNLEKRLAPVRDMALQRPARGWLRAIREALGLTTRQMSIRLGVSQSRIVALEHGEVSDTVTLKSLRQAAEALGCTLVYAIVPTQSLDAMRRERASALADEALRRVSHTMRLENQGLTPDDLAGERERLIAELLDGPPARLWDAE